MAGHPTYQELTCDTLERLCLSAGLSFPPGELEEVPGAKEV